jgi:hypothetical protein
MQLKVLPVSLSLVLPKGDASPGSFMKLSSGRILPWRNYLNSTLSASLCSEGGITCILGYLLHVLTTAAAAYHEVSSLLDEILFAQTTPNLDVNLGRILLRSMGLGGELKSVHEWCSFAPITSQSELIAGHLKPFNMLLRRTAVSLRVF